jgi:MFS family permease
MRAAARSSSRLEVRPAARDNGASREESRPPVFLTAPAGVMAERNFRLYTIGALVSWLTFFCQFTAINWIAWEITGSTTWLSIVAVLSVLPFFLFGPFANVLADRHDRFRILIVGEYAALAHTLLLAAAAFWGMLSIGMLCALVFVGGVVQAFVIPAGFGLLPRAVSAPNLTAAIAVSSAYRMLGMLAGPAVAGVILARFDATAAFLANAAGYVVFIWSLHAMRLPPQAPFARSGRSMAGDFLHGLRYAATHGGIAPVMVLGFCSDGLNRAIVRLLPAFADRMYATGADGLALLMAANGAGATVAALWFTRRRPAGMFTITLIGFAVAILSTAAFTLTTSLWVGVAAAVLFGAGCEAVLTGTSILVQVHVEESLRARVMGSRFLLSQLAGGVALVLLGPLVDQFGLVGPVLACLALCAAAGVWLLVRLPAIDRALAPPVAGATGSAGPK